MSGADAATAGCCATATRAPDLTPPGIRTVRWSVGIMTMYPLAGVVVLAPGRSVVWPVHRSKNLRVKATGMLFCEVEKYIAISTLQEARSHTVALSAEAPGMLQGDAVVQIWILVTG